MMLISTLAGAAVSRYRIYLYVAAAVLIAALVASATAWVMHLRDRAETADMLERREAMLATDMACADGEDVLSCYRRRQAEIAAAQAKRLSEQARVNADEQNRLAAERDRMASELARIDAEADTDQDADEQIPAALRRYYDRKRERMGLK